MEDEGGFISGKMPHNPVAHVGKRARSNAGVVAVFDENARRDFVTGFRKRKQERRNQALVEQEKKIRGKRIRERAERRLQLKIARGGEKENGDTEVEQLETGDVPEWSSGEEFKRNGGGGVNDFSEKGQHDAFEGITKYNGAETTTIVTTTVIDPLADENEFINTQTEDFTRNPKSKQHISATPKGNIKTDKKTGKPKKKKHGFEQRKKDKAKMPRGKSKKLGKGKDKGRKKK